MLKIKTDTTKSIDENSYEYPTNISLIVGACGHNKQNLPLSSYQLTQQRARSYLNILFRMMYIDCHNIHDDVLNRQQVRAALSVGLEPTRPLLRRSRQSLLHTVGDRGDEHLQKCPVELVLFVGQEYIGLLGNWTRDSSLHHK